MNINFSNDVSVKLPLALLEVASVKQEGSFGDKKSMKIFDNTTGKTVLVLTVFGKAVVNHMNPTKKIRAIIDVVNVESIDFEESDLVNIQTVIDSVISKMI